MISYPSKNKILMKLEKILDNLNSFEKNAFLKIINNLKNNKKDTKEIDKILSSPDNDLKNYDSVQIAEVFFLLEEDYVNYIKDEFTKASSQLDLLIDFISRDGNTIMKQDWFSRLYEKEIKTVTTKITAFKKELNSEKPDIDAERLRDYKIYSACVHTAYNNDAANNSDLKITGDEQSILDTLAHHLELSQDERILIKYSILPIEKLNIDAVINDLKERGIIFYSKKNNTIYVADEIVRILRKIRGKEIGDKFFRRVLRKLREPQINMIARKHNIDRTLSLEEKIKEIIAKGISFTGVLKEDIYKPDVKQLDRRKMITELCDNSLKINPTIKGANLDEKISNLILYFEAVEKDERISISHDGYENLLRDLNETLPALNKIIRDIFELQEENVLDHEYLLDYNLKPRDVLELLTDAQLEEFAKARGTKVRGDLVSNILEAYKDSENIYIENYTNIGCRNLLALKENGINIKEADLGIKFEDITKSIFGKLGFDVDEKLRKKINTAKDKIDIILNLGNNDLIIVECKSLKESGYNKFSSISRQLKAYRTNVENQKEGYKIAKILVVAPDFSDDFVTDCREDCELNISLLTASSLSKILEGFKKTTRKEFPHNLFMKDVLIQEDVILKAISKWN